MPERQEICAMIEMEGKGMLMYNRVSGEPSHTMWVIKPLLSSRRSFADEGQTPLAIYRRL